MSKDTGITKEQVYETFSDFAELKDYIESRVIPYEYTRELLAEELTKKVVESNPELEDKEVSLYTLREIIRYVCPNRINEEGGRPVKRA